MKSSHEIEAEAMNAIQALRSLAVHGDEAEAERAAVALLRVSSRAAGHVQALARHPENRPAPKALKQAAAHVESWPVIVPRIEEQRAESAQSQLPKSFGEAAPIRIQANRKGRPRDFNPESRTGFTSGIIDDLINDGEFPLGGDMDDIAIACRDKIASDCQGDWEAFPWPSKLLEDAESESHRANPIKHVAERWIEAGLKSLAP